MKAPAPLRHSRSVRILFPFLVALAWTLLTLLGPIRSVGRYRVPKRGGLVILANHIADVDPIALQVCCPRLVHFMAKSELFAMPLIGPFLRWFHVFPVRRWEPDKGALRHAVALAKAGEAVCVFPEGQLSETGDLQPLLPGAALIVRMAGAPVICCGLLRMNRIIPYGSLIPRPALGWVTVAWGEARRFGPDATAEEILGWAEGQLRMLTGQEERA